jgi:hypothetical protein
MDAIIDSGRGILADAYTMHYFPDDDLLAAARPRALPIGNLTSQFWANVYLNEVDQFAKRELGVRAYLRYVDDLLIFSDSKTDLHTWRDAIADFLQSLRLTIHASHPRRTADGIGFLGFTVFPNHRRLKRRKGISYRRHLKTLIAQCQRHEIPLSAVDSSVQAWLGHVQHGDTWALRRAIFTECRLG